MKMMVDLAHDFLEEILKPSSITVDFTMGNGHDTLFLAQRSAHVYAFDIQKEALEATKNRLDKEHVTNVSLILDGHQFAQNYIPYYDAGIFNLGYLPNASHRVTTCQKTTLQALKTALDYLKSKGRLILVVYPGHSEGQEESDALECFTSALSPHDYHVASLKMTNKKNAPYLIMIDKIY